ncbi:MAG: hypothetical protein IJ213_00090 [Bacteroidales bacterium]|nr:hypothetical protein [Bacteroidales bacterium]
MKKIILVTFLLFGLGVVANAQQKTSGKDIVNTMRKADTKENSCYTKDGKEGRLRVTSRTETTTTSNSSGNTSNSGSRSYTGGTGASIGTNTSASVNSSSTYNSGSSSTSKNNTTTTTVTTEKTCVDKDKLNLYKQ